MIGSLDPTQKKATVVGAGISGLLIAYALKKSGYEVEVLESASEVGGIIHTLNTPFGMVEKAAHSLLITPESRTWFKELGIELEPVNPQSRARFIYRNGKMRRIPLRFSEILKTLFRFFSKPKFPFSPETGSLEDWGESYLGSSATNYLLAPFIAGIFATSPKNLLTKIAFPKLIPSNAQQSLYRHFKRRTIGQRPQMMAPRNGMKSIIDALQKNLTAEIKLNHSVTELSNTPNLILTVPAPALSKLLGKTDTASAESLLHVRYAPLITVTCFLKKEAFAKAPRGVGVLIPRGEGLRIFGCLFNSSSFSKRTLNSSHISVTAMYGGTEDPDVLRLTDGELTLLINQELHVLLKSKFDAVSLEITRRERAIPIYSKELLSAQESLQRGFCARPGRLIFSNFSKEVSIRGLINATLQF